MRSQSLLSFDSRHGDRKRPEICVLPSVSRTTVFRSFAVRRGFLLFFCTGNTLQRKPNVGPIHRNTHKATCSMQTTTLTTAPTKPPTSTVHKKWAQLHATLDTQHRQRHHRREQVAQQPTEPDPYRPQRQRKLEEPIEEPPQRGCWLRHQELPPEDVEVPLELGLGWPQGLIGSSCGCLGGPGSILLELGRDGPRNCPRRRQHANLQGFWFWLSYYLKTVPVSAQKILALVSVKLSSLLWLWLWL